MKRLAMIVAILIAVVLLVAAHPLQDDPAPTPETQLDLTPTPTPETAPIVRWLWNFGDPSSGAANLSTEQNPVHVYSHSKVFSVTLTVWDANGNSDSVTRYVKVVKDVKGVR